MKSPVVSTIALDARAAVHSQPGGFKTYTEHLIRHLPRVDTTHRYLFYIDCSLEQKRFLEAPNVSFEIVSGGMPLIGAGAREQFGLPRRLTQDQVQLAHFPTNTAPLRTPCPFVVTLHDTLIWEEPPELQGLPLPSAIQRASMLTYNRFFARRALLRSEQIITVSNSSKADLIKRFRLDPQRIIVIYEAPSEHVRRIQDSRLLVAARVRFGLPDSFILALGSASPRKNVLGLLNAYAHLPFALREQNPLVVVWTHGLWKTRAADLVNRLDLNRTVRFIQQVTDDDLVALYNAAKLFVFPSISEGFGLPPLEAMSCGLPVLASNLSCLPEVLGDGAFMSDPRDTRGFAAALARVLTDSAFADGLKQRGAAWVRRYSWRRCAQETVQVYEKVLSDRP